MGLVIKLKMLAWTVVLILALHSRDVCGGTCREAYTCSQRCYRKHTTYTACGLFGIFKCTNYRSKGYDCQRTCYRMICCRGYEGSGCNTPVCFGSTICPNGGTCQVPDMCKCPRGFASPRCDDINECSGTTHGCEHDCVNTNGSYHCTCRSGYMLDSNLQSCIDVNECYVNNGDCEHICNNNNGSYTCGCKDGHRLNEDGKTCSDVNECAVETSGCDHVCINTVGSYSCSCNTGFELALDGKGCEDIDECGQGSQQCEAFCQNTAGSYICYCDTGYELNSDGTTCQDIDECLVNNGNCSQVCINQIGSYRCECQVGYRAIDDEGVQDNECEDIDECVEQSFGCSQICNNTDGSYNCSCNTGYYLDNDLKSCIDVDDCENVVCHNGGSCVDGVNSFNCICAPGFTGVYCQTDINECEISNGGCQDICRNTAGSFVCDCSVGRELNKNGFSCTGGGDVTVFERLMILGQLLPKPCFTIKLTECTDIDGVDIFLTSTSEWYRLNSHSSILYTFGIVFVEVGEISLPVSLQGVEFISRSDEFGLNYGVQYDSTNGTVIGKNLTLAECQALELVESDIFDFITVDSFTKTFLLSLFPALPDWLKFEKSSTEVLSVQDIRTDLVYGRNMKDVTWCAGAPVLPNHLYTVFRFDTGLKISVLGDEIDLPKPTKSQKFCLIVDLCQSYGGTVFLMIPDESRDLLLELNIFKILKDEQNIYIQPRGIGISLVNGVNAEYYSFSGDLWNGDHMFVPSLSEIDLWIGGELHKYDSLFTIDGKAEIYMRVPSVQTMLTSMFRDEWTGVIDIQLSLAPVLRFRLFGEEYSVTFQIATATVNAYISFGGSKRLFCGEGSNPEGIFLSAMLEINPFKGIPLLEDFVFSFANHNYAFLLTDVKPLKNITLNIENDIKEIEYVLSTTMTIIDNALENSEVALQASVTEMLTAIKSTVDTVRHTINTTFGEKSVVSTQDMVEGFEVIRQQIYKFKSAVNNLAIMAEFFVYETTKSVINLLQNQTLFLTKSFDDVFNEITKKTMSSVENYTGFGIKCNIDLTVFGLNLRWLDIEIVYSEGDLFRCSRFDKVRNLLAGESALRVLGRVSSGYKLGRFLNYNKGFGVGGAYAVHSKKKIFQLQAFINMLGIKFTTDIFISQDGIYFYFEGNVWDVFLAQIDVFAEVGKDWYQLVYKLQGRFVARSRTKRAVDPIRTLLQNKKIDKPQNLRRARQVQTVSSSFEDSYLDALIAVVRMKSDDAQKRLSQTQSALSVAQKGITKAQSWLDEKQTAVRKANVEFDNAVESLESAKEQLEAAKKPLVEALEKLDEAKKNVNDLCKIRTCRNICIPGIKCKTCRKKTFWGKVSYPCCRFTRCMISFPDPPCVIANIACRIIRAAAYLILENAKITVRTAMLAFDVAKAAVTLAQFGVDKSRVMLTVADGILEIAEIGLEIAKGVLETAKLALEAMKRVIGDAVKLLEFVTEYGLKNIIDVRNCGFSIELSTKDMPVFNVFCEINPLRIGWTTIRLKINFKNIFQSLWQAAKATITAIIEQFDGVFSGRKRRDIEFDASARIHMLLRKIRESNGVNNTDAYVNGTIDIANDIMGFESTDISDSENRIQIFSEKCKKITVIQDFMQFAFESLHDVVNESMSYISEIVNVKEQLKGYSYEGGSENITIENVGISKEFAEMDYNMTDDDLQKVIEDTKTAAKDDPLLFEIQSATNISEQILEEETKSVESIDYQNAWFTSLNNMTWEYFNASECEGFKDCIFYSISTLYDLYEYEDIPNITMIRQSILDLESKLVETFQNESSSIQDTSFAMEYVLNRINALIDMNLFCAKPPEFLTQLQNQTVIYGNEAHFFCHVTGDPVPSYAWLLNDTVIQNENFSRLILSNVTDENSFDKFNCIAGNLVANITSTDAYITVVHENANECGNNNGGCKHVCNYDKGSITCGCYAGYNLRSDAVSCQDIDECEVGNYTCEHACLNVMGGYTCLCSSGSVFTSEDKTCTGLGRNYVSSSLRLNVDKSTTISDPNVNVAIASMLKHYFESDIDGIQSVLINDLRQGSIIADYTVVYKQDKSVNSKVDAIVQAILKLDAGKTLLLNGKPIQVKALLPNNSIGLCQVRKMLAGPCQEEWHCAIDDNMPFCRVNIVKSTDSDSYIYIIVPALGSFVLLSILLVLIFYYRYKLKVRKEKMADTGSGHSHFDRQKSTGKPISTFETEGDYNLILQMRQEDLNLKTKKCVPSANLELHHDKSDDDSKE